MNFSDLKTKEFAVNARDSVSKQASIAYTKLSNNNQNKALRIIGAGQNIDVCIKVADELQSRFQEGLHMVTEIVMHATRRTTYGKSDRLSEDTKVTAEGLT